jgi:hypothetical protein
MRTKALILGAALLAAGVATSMAQSNVYSVNVVGYVNATIPAGGFSMLSNPLLATSNDFNSLLSALPNNSIKVYEWLPLSAGFNIYTKRSTGFSGYDGHAINPGQGFFVQNTGVSPVTNTFVGQVMQGTNSVSYLSGGSFSMISSPAPITGGIETSLGFPAVQNDKLYQWDPIGQGYVIFTRRASSWSGGTGEPQIGVTALYGPAEGFFYTSTAGGTWNQVFTVH